MDDPLGEKIKEAQCTESGSPCVKDERCVLSNMADGSPHPWSCEIPDTPEDLREQASALLAKANALQGTPPASRVVPRVR